MNKLYEKQDTRKYICLAAAVLIAGIITGIVVQRSAYNVEAKIRQTQQKLAGKVLRFHVLANSDTKEDQKLKMQVKEAVLNYMKKELKDADNAEETKQWAKSHESALQKVAAETIHKAGYDYPVTAAVTVSEFPEKIYGDVTFPAGEYEALRIEIGKARGQNWWCVLYPNLCFIDAANAIVPEKGKRELESVLTEDEYEMVTATSKFKIKWFFFGKEPEDIRGKS